MPNVSSLGENPPRTFLWGLARSVWEVGVSKEPHQKQRVAREMLSLEFMGEKKQAECPGMPPTLARLLLIALTQHRTMAGISKPGAVY